MAEPTFGVNAALIEERFGNQSFADQSTRIDRFVQQASGQLDIFLHQVGFTTARAAANSTSRFYQLGQRYVEALVCADLARSNARTDPAYSQNWDKERDRIEGIIVAYVESLDDSYDANENTGSFRTNRVNGSRFVSPRIGKIVSRRFWRRGRIC